MAKSQVEGFDNLIDKLSLLGNAGNKIANKGLKAGAKVIVDQQKRDAPKHRKGPSHGKPMHGADYLKVGNIRTAKSKNKYIQVGITDAETWHNAKGVYFQHFGFFNHRNKRYVAGSQWIDNSFKKSKSNAANVLLKYLESEIKL